MEGSNPWALGTHCWASRLSFEQSFSGGTPCCRRYSLWAFRTSLLNCLEAETITEETSSAQKKEPPKSARRTQGDTRLSSGHMDNCCPFPFGEAQFLTTAHSLVTPPRPSISIVFFLRRKTEKKPKNFKAHQPGTYTAHCRPHPCILGQVRGLGLYPRQ